MPVEHDSPYQKLWDAGIGNTSTAVVVEVGINDGRGILLLRDRFPKAHIFAIDEHVREPYYESSFDQLAEKLSGIATLVIEKSPLPFDWPFLYDFCSIDIGADPIVNLRNIEYWLRFKKPGGVLAIVVPRSTPEKMEKREFLIQALKKLNRSFQEIHNWFVFS